MQTARAEIQCFRLGPFAPINDGGIGNLHARLSLPWLRRTAERARTALDSPAVLDARFRRGQHGREGDFVTGDPRLPLAATLPLSAGAQSSGLDHEAKIVQRGAVARDVHGSGLRGVELLSRTAASEPCRYDRPRPRFLLVLAGELHSRTRCGDGVLRGTDCVDRDAVVERRARAAQMKRIEQTRTVADSARGDGQS